MKPKDAGWIFVIILCMSFAWIVLLVQHMIAKTFGLHSWAKELDTILYEERFEDL